MSWRYKYHLEAQYGNDNEKLKYCPERVTWLTFEQWLSFYHGDPEHWVDLENSNYRDNHHSYHLPAYKKISMKKIRYNTIEGIKEDTEDYEIYIYIKFLTRSDYRKYKKYLKTLFSQGKDFENQREILELAQYIGKIADERLREAQERTQRAIDENEKLMKEARLRLSKELEGGQKYELSF